MRKDVDVIIYTDGGYRRSVKIGAWGCVVINPKKNKAIKKAEAVKETTNNRMELMAVIKGLEILKTKGRRVHVISDSQYTINSCSKWLDGWKSNGWTKSTPGELKNVDILKRIDELLQQHTVTFEWVRGHSGDRGNDYVDNILNQAMDDLIKGGHGTLHGHIDSWE